MIGQVVGADWPSGNWRKLQHCTVCTYTVNVKKIRCGNIFAIYAGTIILSKYSPRIVHHVILVTLNLAIDSLWNFFNVALLPGSPWRRFTRIPRDHLPHQSCDRPPQKLTIKQVHVAAIAKASKKKGNGRFNAKTST